MTLRAELQNQWSGVRILPLLPLLGTKEALGITQGSFLLWLANHLIFRPVIQLAAMLP